MSDNLSKNDPLGMIRRKVLIVDDQSINREILGEILKDGYEVLYSEDGRKALEIMRDNGAELAAVLLDLTMPVMDGYEVLRIKMNDAAISGIPVLVATQRDGDEEEIKALSLGAVDFLTKPYKPEIIRYRVANTIMLKESRSMLDMVERDSVTGLYTKEFFYSYADRLMRENPETSYDLLEADIDNFKLVNDLYGKDIGDRLLKALAAILMDSISLLGGFASHVIADDFVCILPHREDYDEFLQSILEMLEKEKDIPVVKLRFGIYNISDTEIPVNIMCDRVTMATDAAKNQYTTPYVFYDDDMRKKLMEDQVLTSCMQKALDTHQFKVFFQPKFSLSNEAPAGAEALVRWIHPEKGFLSPGIFIPLFEGNGLIYKLDRYVWEETCRYISEFKKKYGRCVPVSVNISRIDVYDPRLPEILDGLI